MQSVKNKLALFNSLRENAMPEVDLQLLEQKYPQHPDIPRFRFCPERSADDILFTLLDFATEDEIIETRNSAENSIDKTPNPADKPLDGEGDENPTDETPNPDDKPLDGEGDENPTDETPNPADKPLDGEGNENPEDKTRKRKASTKPKKKKKK